MTPRRVQLRRTKGWRKPEGAVVVARPSKWGNPYRIGAPTPLYNWPVNRAEAVESFRDWMSRNRTQTSRARAALAGKDLACWCALDEPCHADVLLELANIPDAVTA